MSYDYSVEPDPAWNFLRDPLFLTGLSVRLVLIIGVLPHIQLTWFVPFVTHTVSNPTLDPWGAYLGVSNDALAYPYGVFMLLAHLPITAFGAGLDLLLGRESYFAGLGFRLTLLAFEILAVVALSRIVSSKVRMAVLAFWLSPLAVYITYWHGQTDIVPVSLALVSYACLKANQFRNAGAAIGLAIASKLSMVIAGPFFVVYLWQNNRLRSHFIWFVVFAAAPILLSYVFWLPADGFREMVLGTPEIGKIYQLSLPLDSTNPIYFVPMVYIFTVYAAWRLRRSSFDHLVAMSGVAFLIIVVMTYSSPGWYLWSVPFLSIYVSRADRLGIALVALFTLFALSTLPISSGATIAFSGYDFFLPSFEPSSHQAGLRSTAIVILGILISMRLARDGIQRSDYHRLTRRCLSIGIAGDSGSGKTTLAEALAGLFGNHSVTHISGDAYHRWDRRAPMWKTLTHLNPQANDLGRMAQDATTVIDGHQILAPQYDHRTGSFTRPVAVSPNEVVIISGLHVLLTPALTDKLDLKIFVEIDEPLRLQWKYQRDVAKRSRSMEDIKKSVEMRRHDAKVYIVPQKEQAELVFMLTPVNEDVAIATAEHADLPLKLRVLVRNKFYHQKLARALVALCGMQVDTEIREGGRLVELTISGEVWSDDIRLASNSLVPHLEEVLDIEPNWKGNALGVMQLVTLVHISDTLRLRRVS